MNTIDYGIGNAIIPFNDIPIVINGVTYKNLVAVVKLLNPEQLLRLDKILTDDPIQKDLVDEDIVRTCLLDIIGVDGEVDLDNASAGFVQTISRAVYLQSISYILNSKEYHEELSSQVTLIETMSAVIARFLNIQYTEVITYPINIIYKYYAICRSAFPNEVSDIVDAEEPEVSKIGED